MPASPEHSLRLGATLRTSCVAAAAFASAFAANVSQIELCKIVATKSDALADREASVGER